MKKIFSIILILILLITASCNKCSSCCSHNYLGETVIFPTCETVGKRKYTCEVCEDSYEEVLDELWHTPNEYGKCIRCERNIVTNLSLSYTQDTKGYVINSAIYDQNINEELVFEDKINGFDVREIGEGAFIESKFRTVNLPSSVKKINKNAFKDSLNMYSVNLNKGVEMIYEGAFSGCVTLSEITIYPSLLYVGEGAFAGCLYLQKINFMGTQEQFAKIVVAGNNDLFLNASIVFIDG